MRVNTKPSRLVPSVIEHLRFGGFALLLLCGGVSTAFAAPINYTISFTLFPGYSPAPTSGNFTYDPAGTGLFSAFMVNWDGFTFDLTNAANNPFSDGCGPATAAGFFQSMTSGVCPSSGGPVWGAQYRTDINLLDFTFVEQSLDGSGSLFDAGIVQGGVVSANPRALGAGNYSISQAATVPEPFTVSLFGVGLAGAVVTRRRRKRVRSV